MKIVKEKNLILDIKQYDVILVPMSINNSMAKGFKYEISINFPYVKEKESETPYGDRRKYGTILPIEVDGTVFCLCYMYTTPNRSYGDFVQYESLKKCLKEVNNKFKGLNVASVIMGADKYDGSGDKEKILDIFNNELPNVILYDYEQPDYSHDIFVEIAILRSKLKERSITPQEYIEARSEVEWRRKHGIYNTIPENYKFIPRKGEIFD